MGACKRHSFQSFLPRSKSELGRSLYSQGNGGNPGGIRIELNLGPPDTHPRVPFPSLNPFFSFAYERQAQDSRTFLMMSLLFYARPGPIQLGWREAQRQTAQMLCFHYLTLVQARLLRSHKEGTGQPCWLIKPIQGPHGNSFSSPLAFPSADSLCQLTKPQAS